MKVFLIRHGDADAEIPEALDDDARSLTARAREALPGHFLALAQYFGRIDALFTSPLMRTVQTATLLANALKYPGAFRAHRALLPDSPVGGLDALLHNSPARTVIVVGHQPSMGAAAAHFLGAPFSKPVSPGTVIGIERGQSPRLICYAQVGQPVLETL